MIVGYVIMGHVIVGLWLFAFYFYYSLNAFCYSLNVFYYNLNAFQCTYSHDHNCCNCQHYWVHELLWENGKHQSIYFLLRSHTILVNCDDGYGYNYDRMLHAINQVMESRVMINYTDSVYEVSLRNAVYHSSMVVFCRDYPTMTTNYCKGNVLKVVFYYRNCSLNWVHINSNSQGYGFSVDIVVDVDDDDMVMEDRDVIFLNVVHSMIIR